MSSKKKAKGIIKRWLQIHKLWEKARAKSEKAIEQADKLLKRRETRLADEAEKLIRGILKTGCEGVGLVFREGELWIECSPHNLDPIHKVKAIHKATRMRTIHFMVTYRFREVQR